MMGKNSEKLFLSVGLVLYLFDLGSDIYVAGQYWKNKETSWFCLTVGFICVPSLIVNLTAMIRIKNIWRLIAAILQLSSAVRYMEAVIKPEKRTGIFSRNHLRLRYRETIMRCAPQCCFQVYIMSSQWSFPSHTVASSVFSMLSLVWSILELERERRASNNRDFMWIDVSMFFTWQTSMLISRLLVIIFFANVFQQYVIIALAVHWLTVGSTILLIGTSDCDNGKPILDSFLAACPSLFHSARNDYFTKRPKLETRLKSVFLIIANFAMISVSLGMIIYEVSCNVMKEIIVVIILAVLSSYVIMLCLYRKIDIDEDNDDAVDTNDVPKYTLAYIL